jgi:surfeit locus 1 family protein
MLLFAGLGIWQLDRAAEKRSTLAEFEGRGTTEINLNHCADERSASSGYRAVGRGRYLNATILLENQLHRGRAGYLVYTAFGLDGCVGSVLVNRGWIGANADRNRTPDVVIPASPQRVSGRLSLPPTAGLYLAGVDLVEHLAQGKWRVQGVDFVGLTASLGREFRPITLLLDDDVQHGFIRDWILPASDETRHFGYAFQWFALALTLLIVTTFLTVRNIRARPL